MRATVTASPSRDCHVALALAALVLLGLIIPLPAVRLPIVALFLVVAPGLALTAAPDVRRLGGAVVVAVSLATDVVVSEVVMYAGVWSGTRAVMAIAAVTSLVATYRLHVLRQPSVSRTFVTAAPERRADREPPVREADDW